MLRISSSTCQSVYTGNAGLFRSFYRENFLIYIWALFSLVKLKWIKISKETQCFYVAMTSFLSDKILSQMSLKFNLIQNGNGKFFSHES